MWEETIQKPLKVAAAKKTFFQRVCYLAQLAQILYVVSTIAVQC